jgi:hypothetical protein
MKFMVDSLSAIWVHGNTAKAQTPSRVNEVRFTFSTRYTPSQQPEDGINWFHFPMLTPVSIEGVSPRLSKVFVLYHAETPGGHEIIRVNEVDVFDGPRLVQKFEDNGNDLNLTGDHGFEVDPSNTWNITIAENAIRIGLGISVRAYLPEPDPDLNIIGGLTFTSAGAMFST